MSDYDRNYAARSAYGAGQAAAIDAGLRAYMIRIYNYMAAGVALTGVAAWLTFSAAVQTNAAGQLALTSFGKAIYGGPLMIVLFLGTLGMVFFLSFRISHLQPSTALGLFMVYAALLGVMLVLPAALIWAEGGFRPLPEIRGRMRRARADAAVSGSDG